MKYGATTYLYRKDAQNNVIALIGEDGAVVARYLYDAWGNMSVVDNNGTIISNTSHIGNLNPFRYRGYYYDTETKLYFLKTRYYDPEIGRFMTIDGIEYLNPETINGLNLYAYCGNNPVMRVDENGNAWWHWVVGAVVLVAVVALAVVTYGASLTVTAAAVAGIESTVSAVTIGLASISSVAIGAAVTGVAAAGIGLLTGGITYTEGKIGWDWNAASEGFMWGAIGGSLSGAASSFGTAFGIVASAGMNIVQQLATTRNVDIYQTLIAGCFAYIGGQFSITTSINGINTSGISEMFKDIIVGGGFGMVEWFTNLLKNLNQSGKRLKGWA